MERLGGEVPAVVELRAARAGWSGSSGTRCVGADAKAGELGLAEPSHAQCGRVVVGAGCVDAGEDLVGEGLVVAGQAGGAGGEAGPVVIAVARWVVAARAYSIATRPWRDWSMAARSEAADDGVEDDGLVSEGVEELGSGLVADAGSGDGDGKEHDPGEFAGGESLGAWRACEALGDAG